MTQAFLKNCCSPWIPAAVIFHPQSQMSLECCCWTWKREIFADANHLLSCHYWQRSPKWAPEQSPSRKKLGQEQLQGTTGYTDESKWLVTFLSKLDRVLYLFLNIITQSLEAQPLLIDMKFQITHLLERFGVNRDHLRWLYAFWLKYVLYSGRIRPIFSSFLVGCRTIAAIHVHKY